MALAAIHLARQFETIDCLEDFISWTYSFPHDYVRTFNGWWVSDPRIIDCGAGEARWISEIEFQEALSY